MPRINRRFLYSGLCFGGLFVQNATALDHDFVVIGNGEETPSELAVYRRAEGYAVAVRRADPRREFRVYFDCDNSQKTGEVHGPLGAEYRLNEDGSIERYASGKWMESGRAQKVLSQSHISSYYIRDELLSVPAENQIGVICSFKDSKRYLPDESNGVLLVSGSRKNTYSMNHPDNTILRQVSNTKVLFEDPAGDIIHPGNDDLISGSAEIKKGELHLTCLATAPLKNNVNIWIDSVPSVGYGAMGADFMLDGKNLFRYSGGDGKKWSWEKLSPMTPETAKGGAEVLYRVPLNEIRPQKYGRLRVLFQAAPGMKEGDTMPSRGKVLPVLRPGNLAAAPGTRVEVSSLYPKYKIYPLTDGQTARQIYYSYAAWASAVMPGKAQFADFIFKNENPINQVSIWWEMPPQEIEILAKQGNEWRPLAKTSVREKEFWTNIPMPENSRAEAIRVQMPAGKGNISRPNLLWIREVEIY